MPLRVAAGLQLLNFLLIVLVTPESNPRAKRAGRSIDWREANPLGSLWKLFGHAPVLRNAAAMYGLVSLARNALDAQFVNYASIRFGWSQQQTGPVMVIVGLMLAIAPQLLVPRVRPAAPRAPFRRRVAHRAGSRRRPNGGHVAKWRAGVATPWPRGHASSRPTLIDHFDARLVSPHCCGRQPDTRAPLRSQLGLMRAILVGMLVFSGGLSATAFAPTPSLFIAAIVLVSVGCVCIPALQAFLTNLADPHERGAVLGALGSLTELTNAIGSTLYAAVLAHFTSEAPLLKLPGMHFLVGAALLLAAFALVAHTFAAHPAQSARATEM